MYRQITLRAFWIALLGVFLLSGCVTQSKVKTSSQGIWPSLKAAQRAAQLGPLRNWDLEGRLGVQMGDEGFSAGLVWQQRVDRFHIELFDQLGRKVAILSGTPTKVDLRTAKGQRFTGDNPETLLREHVGWSVPIRSLFYWVRGLPDPKTVSWREDYNDQGLLVALEQGGWQVQLSRYSPFDDFQLPRLVKMVRDDIKLKLLIKKWS